MNQTLIDNWNQRVGINDDGYILGDFALTGIEGVKEILQQLNGNIILILGNHDRQIAKQHGLFHKVYKALELRIGPRKILLTHRPADEANGPSGKPYDINKYAVCLCGHVHEKWRKKGTKIINVGVDVWDFKPITFEDILREINGKTPRKS